MTSERHRELGFAAAHDMPINHSHRVTLEVGAPEIVARCRHDARTQARQLREAVDRSRPARVDPL